MIRVITERLYFFFNGHFQAEFTNPGLLSHRFIVLLSRLLLSLFYFISVTHVIFKLHTACSKSFLHNLQLQGFSLFSKIPNAYPTSVQVFIRCHQTKRKKIFVCMNNTCTYFRSITVHNLRAQKYVLLLLLLPDISVR